MEREALAALEKRVEALRLRTAERAVLARSLAGEPMRHHAELSTAVLALVVFVVFLIGRQIGTMMPRGASCAGIAPNANATITLERRGCFGPCPAYTVTLDTDGVMTWTGTRYVERRGYETRRVDPAAVRRLANALATSCFFETVAPPSHVTDVSKAILSLRTIDREQSVLHDGVEPVTLCGSHADIALFDKAVDDLAGVKDLIGEPGAIRDTFR